jgi:hypothetical protein
MVEKLREHLASPEGKASMEKHFLKLAEREKLAETRHRRFEEWLEKNDFDKLMYRLILEHGDEYVDKCYHNGHMPHPNRKLAFVIDYIIHNIARIKVRELDCDFANEIYFFKGYYLQHIMGQGVITRIYNKDDMSLILQV